MSGGLRRVVRVPRIFVAKYIYARNYDDWLEEWRSWPGNRFLADPITSRDFNQSYARELTAWKRYYGREHFSREDQSSLREQRRRLRQLRLDELREENDRTARALEQLRTDQQARAEKMKYLQSVRVIVHDGSDLELGDTPCIVCANPLGETQVALTQCKPVAHYACLSCTSHWIGDKSSATCFICRAPIAI